VVFCCLRIMSFGVLFFMVWHRSTLIRVVCCAMFGWCALWTKLYKGRCFKCCGGRLVKFIATILLIWGSWTISF
jgi:hypothetical protein